MGSTSSRPISATKMLAFDTASVSSDSPSASRVLFPAASAASERGDASVTSTSPTVACHRWNSGRPHQPQSGANGENHEQRCGQPRRPGACHNFRAPCPLSWRKFNLQERRDGVIVPETSERTLELLNLWIWQARAIPEVVVLRRALFVFVCHLPQPCLPMPRRFGAFASAPRGPSFSRNCRIPRFKFTRTEPCERPVFAAISGPVMPSTSRKIRVSR